MTVVYYVRPGDRNEELRYSLRSLRNLPHERVVIVGHTPSWVRGVESIPGNHVHGGPMQTAVGNLLRACEAVDAERFVVFNDDFYVMEPIEGVPSWHAGPLDAKVSASGYGAMLREAGRQLRERGIVDPLAWTLHIPVVVVRDLLGRILAGLRPNRRVLPEWRTMYGNLAGVRGEQVPDVKVTTAGQPLPDGPFLSTLDSYLPPVLRRRFPDPSPYEAVA